MSNFQSQFRCRTKKRKLNIAVVGLGYVGLPLAVEFAKKGFSVLGVDLDKNRVQKLRKKKSYITDIPEADVKKLVTAGRLKAEAGFHSLKISDVVLVCVPTPLIRGSRRPDISFVKTAVEAVSRNIKPGTLVILESTTYPGTTEEVILPIFEKQGLKHGVDFYLCFSPERIDPGNEKYPLNKIPKVIGGLNKEAGMLADLLYRQIIAKTVIVSSPRVAEIVKLLENTFRLINIGLIDEMAIMAHKMNIDIWEVIEAAKTKPFGFMPFYPGPGVGGHCLDKNETLFVKNNNTLEVMQIDKFMGYLRKNNSNDNIEVLSFDPVIKKSVFKKVLAVSGRTYPGTIVNIRTEDGRQLKVTDLHPMFVHNEKWQLKYAKDLRKGDSLPLCLELPQLAQDASSAHQIDIIEQIRQKGSLLIKKIRVKPVGFSWKDYALQLKRVMHARCHQKLPEVYWDYISDNYLPLSYFYELEKLIKIEHSALKLTCGRGPSYSEIPAKITLNEDLCRLIGYYLSEGCYTKDKSARIRFTFNRSEIEYIQDVIAILNKLGIKTSIYESKTSHASCIKVSSNIFGFLIYEILGCGNNCYNMNIPSQFFAFNARLKKALISGIFRGDACVEHFFGKWRYRKNQNEYFHKVNTANISFFTSSRKLFQQITILLHDLGIIPTFRKRKYTLSIFGYKQLEFLRDIFDGRKKEIIERYLKLNKNRPKNKTFERFDKFATVKIKSISRRKGGEVYSIETDKPHTFVTSYGIIVHNCIPKDPLYLYWKAKKFGFHSRFINLASETISQMPKYITERIRLILQGRGMQLSDAQILVIGATYKKDIRDLRKSPSLDIIEILKNTAKKVSYYDPLIPYLKMNHIDLKSINLNKQALSKFDCVVIATDHSSVNYKFLRENSKLIFDTRNVYKNLSAPHIYKL